MAGLPYAEPASDSEFVRRILGVSGTWARSTALTTAKFNSALRPNSYVERRCDEQDAMLARLRRHDVHVWRNDFLKALARAPALA